MEAKPDNSQFDAKWEQSIKKHKSEETYVFVPRGEKPKTQRQLFLRQYYEIIRDFSQLSRGSKVLEMGCGRGTVSLYFGAYENADISLCDVSESAVKLAKENLDHFDVHGSVVACSADTTPYDSSYFDVVFSIGLLEHLEDYGSIVEEKFRVLKPGGSVASLNIPKKRSIQIVNSWYRFILRPFVKKGSLKKDYYRNSHTPEQFKQAFVDAGFEDVEIVYVSPFPLLTPLWGPVEYLLTYIYKALLVLRSPFRKHSFMAGKIAGQAHFILAKKPGK